MPASCTSEFRFIKETVHCSRLRFRDPGFGAYVLPAVVCQQIHREVVCRRQIAAHVAVWMSGTGPFLGFVTIVATGGLLWALAVVILEISCGVKLVLQKHVEAPFQRGDNGSALELIGLLRHVFVLVPLTVFLAYAAWVVEAAAICLASATVVTYYLVLQRAWPQGSLAGCVVLGALVFRSYDAYFQHQVASRVRQRLSNRPRQAD